MSKKHKSSLAVVSSNSGRNATVKERAETEPNERLNIRPSLRYLRAHLAATLVIAFLSIGAIGAVLKYFDESAQAEKRLQAKDRSLISSINPFLVTTPTPTPQLSKEYIYAGSRLLAVEDANANAAPPADLAVWRPSSGTWYVLGGPGSQQVVKTWGMNGDTPVPGDFDGDGKTDFSIFRPSANPAQWWIFRSSDSTYYSVQFGTSGDLVAPADYDGDGKTDIAVYRPSTGYWYINHVQNVPHSWKAFI